MNKVRTEKFPVTVNTISSQIQEAHQSPRNMKKTKSRHFIVKLLQSSNKKKSQKQTKEKRVINGKTKVRMTSNFLSGTVQVGRLWIFRNWKTNSQIQRSDCGCQSQGLGDGENGWRWPKVQTASYKRRSGGVTFSMVTKVNNTVLRIQKLLRKEILKVFLTRKKVCTYVKWRKFN